MRDVIPGRLKGVRDLWRTLKGVGNIWQIGTRRGVIKFAKNSATHFMDVPNLKRDINISCTLSAYFCLQAQNKFGHHDRNF